MELSSRVAGQNRGRTLFGCNAPRQLPVSRVRSFWMLWLNGAIARRLEMLGPRLRLESALFGWASRGTAPRPSSFASTLAAPLASAAFVLSLAMGGVARAAPFDPEGQDWEGLSQLVRMAQSDVGAERVKVSHALDLAELKANDSLLLIHPMRSLDAAELAAFMHAGGRVVLLDDYGTGDTLLAHFGIHRVPLPKHPAEMLRGRPEFAIAEPVSVHDAVRDVARVVTNHGTGLADTGLLPLLVVHGQDEPDVLVGVAGIVGKGRFLAVGDASVVMNAMLRYPGNHALGAALLRYVSEDTAGPEAADAAAAPGTLYIAANDCVLRGSFAEGAALSAPAAQARRAVLAAIESLRNGVPPFAAYLVALALGMGVVVWTSTRAGRTHKATNPRFVRPIPAIAQGGAAGHAALLGAQATPRLLAAVELKNALEEQLAARLRAEGALSHDELVEKARASGLVDGPQALALSRLLATLSRYERSLLKPEASRRTVRVREVVAIAREVRSLLAAIETRRGVLE